MNEHFILLLNCLNQQEHSIILFHHFFFQLSALLSSSNEINNISFSSASFPPYFIIFGAVLFNWCMTCVVTKSIYRRGKNIYPCSNSIRMRRPYVDSTKENLCTLYSPIDKAVEADVCTWCCVESVHFFRITFITFHFSNTIIFLFWMFLMRDWSRYGSTLNKTQLYTPQNSVKPWEYYG